MRVLGRWLGIGGLLAASISALPAAATSAAVVAGPTLTVNVAAVGPKINPDIYGASYPTAAFAAAARISLSRWGGNATTRYDYRSDYFNTGSDWYFENYPENSSRAAGAPSTLDTFISSAAAGSRDAAITVPVLGWVAKANSDCGFPTSTYGAQQSTDYWRPLCGNGVSTGGSPLTVTRPPSDTSVAFGPSEVTTMASHFASSHASSAPSMIFQLDNEPTLWNSTHRDLQPTAITASALFSKSVAAADAIKSGYAKAIISGPGDWGWCAYFYYPADNCAPGADRTAHGNLDLAAAYLKAFHDHDVAVGHRTLSVFDEHFYPQGNGVALATGTQSAATQALRLRSTRALWDPTYVDESWISGTSYPNVDLLPRMKQWVSTYYPGTAGDPTGISIGEYNFGALDSMNGALAQADVLGILGRAGVRWAALWAPPDSGTSPGAFAFRMYRNLDGAGAGFGTTSVGASSTDQGRLSVYAATRPDGTLTVVAINKTASDLASPLNIAGMTPGPTAIVYRYSGADLSRIVVGSASMGVHTALTFPANSITTLVIPPATGLTPSVMSIRSSAGALAYPTAATITARLTTRGVAVAGAPVGIYARQLGVPGWKLIARLTTNPTGYVNLIVHPTRHTEYAANDLRPRSSSVWPAASTSVGPTNPLIRVGRGVSAVVTPSTIALGRSATVSGIASPSGAGLVASLQVRIGTTWRTAATTKLAATSRYAFLLHPGSRGTWSYRVVVAPDTFHLAGYSPIVTLRAT